MAINFDPKDLAKMASILSKDSSFLDVFQQEMVGNFEPALHVNTKTVFANPLAIHVRINDLAASLAGTNEHAIRQLTDARNKLERTVANETKCSGCLHLDITVEDNKNLATGVTEFRLRTLCKRGKSAGTTSIICPDGNITAKDGSTTSARMPPLAVFEPSEMSMREARRRDEPTTNTGDTAW